MIVASALFAVTFASNDSAVASTHHGKRHVYSVASGHRMRGHHHVRYGLRHHFASFRHFERRHHAHRAYGWRQLHSRHAASLIRRYVGSREAYAPVSSPSGSYVQTGGASFYSSSGRTATGGHVGSATCAHRSLPFGTRVLVTNLNNARQAVLTVNDRGPFVRGRVVDVSRAAANMLGMLQSGIAHVRVQVVGSRS